MPEHSQFRAGSHRILGHILGAMVGGLLALIVFVPVTQAQGAIVVDPPFNLSNTSTSSLGAILIGDRSGLVHVVWVEDMDGPALLPDQRGAPGNTLMYTVWDGQGWSTPVDIYFVSQGESIQNPRASVDSSGILHAIWFEMPDRLKYAQVPASQATSARYWTTPVELYADAGGIEDGAAILVEDDGTVHVMYAAGNRFRVQNEPRSVQYVRSTDAGANWSEPVVLVQFTNFGRGANDISLYRDPSGLLHAVWQEWDETGVGVAVYYTRSLDHGQTWAPVEVFAQWDQAKPSIESYTTRPLVWGDTSGDLFRFWIGGPPAAWYYQLSRNGGGTWGPTERPFPDLIGDEGPPTLAEDSLGRLHLFVSQRGADGGPIRDIGLWHSMWDGRSWSYPQLTGPVERSGFNPKAAIVRGNEFLVSWWAHSLAEVIVMKGRVTDAPAQTSVAWPTVTQPAAIPRATPTPPGTGPTSTATPTRPAGLIATLPPAAIFQDTAVGVILPAGAALAVIGVVAWTQRMRSQRFRR